MNSITLTQCTPPPRTSTRLWGHHTVMCTSRPLISLAPVSLENCYAVLLPMPGPSSCIFLLKIPDLKKSHIYTGVHRWWLFGWLVVFYILSTARSFRDSAPIYSPLRRMWSSVLKPFPPGIEPRAVAWQSITLPLRHTSSTLLFLRLCQIFTLVKVLVWLKHQTELKAQAYKHN